VTDQDLVAKKLAFIETCLHDLRQQARPDRLSTDVRELRFVEHTLQITIQAALDVASHIVSDNRLGEPRTNRELFDLLGRHGWLAPPLVDALRDMGGFRNVLVHGYADVDVKVVRDVLDRHLPDFEAFVAAIRQRIGETG
jgi:uncharacterized protein YutE (UPF0331/DUF86 family)